MKVLKYQVLQSEINHGTKENPDIEVILLPMERFSDEANLERNCAIARAEAYNGEYTIEDDGAPEPAPTQLDRIESQVTYTAMMTDTLIMET